VDNVVTIGCARTRLRVEEEMAEERFLVTGALGCIGAWAVKRLLAENVPVWTYDLPGNPHRLRLIMGEGDLKRVNFVEGDITDQATFERTVTDNGITHIVHLAALQVPFVRADPVQGMRVNVVGSTIVLETAKRHAEQVQGLVYASSVAVYGPVHLYPPGPLQHDAPHLPATLYGVSKQANEWTAKVYWNDYKVRSVGLRPFFVYGPGRDQGISSVPTKAMLAAAPEMAGKITYDTVPIPVPEDVDGKPAEDALGPANWRPFADGVRDTIADFRAAVAAGTLDVERAIA
jgi:UDP-glucuronate 4-epimerase